MPTAFLSHPLLAVPLAGGGFFQDANTWVLAAFLIFSGILIYAGVPKFIGDALEKRADGIRKQLDEARQLREEAQKKLAEFERKHAEVERQAEEIVTRARREAEAAAADAKKSIEASVAQRLQSAEDQIALAEADAVRAVRNIAVDAAVEATQAVLKSGIDGAAHGKLLDAAIKEAAATSH